ncbi:MAG: response regulator transcription factor [Gammaproteobacteria bacterium]|nr:response regulator transcription factor [Gammaproteobacteria bacterium]MCP5423565.1 response regulator transcription factor [Gammaproteobacteria bacterium]
MNPQPSVFLVDDDEAVRDSLSLSLEMDGLKVECFASARDFLESYDASRPGCLVLDVRMPDMSGLELQEVLATRRITIPIIFITGHGDVPMSVKAVKAGAVDFLEKPFKKEVLQERIQEALAQDAQMRKEWAERQQLRRRLEHLTPREQEVMALVVGGHSNKDIARRLDISPRTVETHRARIMEKMGATSLPDLVTLAAACGMITANE